MLVRNMAWPLHSGFIWKFISKFVFDRFLFTQNCILSNSSPVIFRMSIINIKLVSCLSHRLKIFFLGWSLLVSSQWIHFRIFCGTIFSRLFWTGFTWLSGIPWMFLSVMSRCDSLKATFRGTRGSVHIQIPSFESDLPRDPGIGPLRSQKWQSSESPRSESHFGTCFADYSTVNAHFYIFYFFFHVSQLLVFELAVLRFLRSWTLPPFLSFPIQNYSSFLSRFSQQFFLTIFHVEHFVLFFPSYLRTFSFLLGAVNCS